MKTIVLALFLFGFSAVAEDESVTSPTEATASLNCEHSVPGTSCPVKYSASCQTLLCDSKVTEASSSSIEDASK